MSCVILTEKGHVIIRKCVWGLIDDDLNNLAMKAEIAALDKHIKQKLDTPIEDISPSSKGPVFTRR
jgi:hypothetical protein